MLLSKKSLKNICLECEKEMSKNYVRCPFRSISNEYCEEYETIKKDLEVLEILKKHYDVNSLIVSLNNFISFCIYNDDKDFNKIKEWLENDC